MSAKSICIVAALVSALVVSGVTVAALSREPEDRYGMTEEQWQEFKLQAEQWKLTPAELKAFIDREVGTPLLFDRKHKVGVTWQAAEDGTARQILIVADATGPHRFYIDCNLGNEPDESRFTYGSAPRDSKSLLAVTWQDWNSDGVFDVLLVMADHHPLLKLDRGAYILIDGQWIAARRHETDRELFVTIDGEVPYRFDHASGAWAPD